MQLHLCEDSLGRGLIQQISNNLIVNNELHCRKKQLQLEKNKTMPRLRDMMTFHWEVFHKHYTQSTS